MKKRVGGNPLKYEYYISINSSLNLSHIKLCIYYATKSLCVNYGEWSITPLNNN